MSSLKNVRNVLVFGLLQGSSIRWLSERYPDAMITACDILPVQPPWPRSRRIRYYEVEGSPQQVRELFAGLGEEFDLIIENGSHHPVQQKNCVVEGVH